MRLVAGDLAWALPAVLVMAGATSRLLGLSATYVLVVVSLYAVLSGLLLRGRPGDLPGPGLGAANRITLGRAVLALPVGALALTADMLGATGYWWIIALSTVAMLLDGLDGRIARATGTETLFGARFDMELDAALIMILSLLVWMTGKVGAWVLLVGLMRYAFVAAAAVWPALRADLPDSFRRKAVCVLQGVALLVALGPIISPSLAMLVAGAGISALTYSFAVDVHFLLRRPA